MWVRQVKENNQPMFRYPANGLNWGLVPMNRVSYGDASALRDCGTFFLRAGLYAVVGAVSGTTTRVQAALVPVSGNPLQVDIHQSLADSTGSFSGADNFVASFEVPDDGSGGSVLGLYQFFTPGPNTAVNVGISEVYASILFLPQLCPQAPLQFAARQRVNTDTVPQQVTKQAWNSLYLTDLQDFNQNTPAGTFLVPPNETSFYLRSGLYLILGIVMSNLYVGSCALALDGPSQAFLPAEGNMLLQSSSGVTQGDQHFQGVVSVPDDGTGGSKLKILGYPVVRDQFGTSVGSGLKNIYVNLAFVSLNSLAPACKPFTPLPSFFSVLQTYPSGQDPPVFVDLGSSFSQVPLTTVVGPPPPASPTEAVALLPSVEAGCFLLPAGSWYVLGTTPASNGRQPAAGALCSLTSLNQIYFDPQKVLLQSTNAFSGNMEFAGVVVVPQSTWVCLFVSYQSGQTYGSKVGSNLPEIYTQLTFLAM